MTLAIGFTPPVCQSPPGIFDGSIHVEYQSAMFRIGPIFQVSCQFSRQISGCQELTGHHSVFGFLQFDQERRIRVARHIIQEEWLLAFNVELAEDYMTHSLRQGPVRAGVHPQPLIAKLGVISIIRRNRHDFLPVIAGFGHEVSVWGTGQGNVRPPHDEVLRVEPVARLGNIGLIAENLRRGGREVSVPVIERQHDPAQQFIKPRSGGVRNHRHGGNHREPG